LRALHGPPNVSFTEILSLNEWRLSRRFCQRVRKAVPKIQAGRMFSLAKIQEGFVARFGIDETSYWLPTGDNLTIN